LYSRKLLNPLHVVAGGGHATRGKL
jgi:hypothetical protein